jgi:putative copper resistance protein D
METNFMEDSKDLKKRILNMREANNINNEFINPGNIVEKKSTPNIALKQNILFTKSNSSIQNDTENFNTKKIQDNNTSSFEKDKKEIQYNYDDQFKLLANKFNEAVEVILELTESIAKLEKVVYVREEKNKKINYAKNGNIFKLSFYFALIILIFSSIFFLPVNIEYTNLFNMEVWSFLNPIIRMIFYISAFGSVGTLIYLVHFYRLLEFEQRSYCFSLIKKSSIIGSIIAFLSFLSIPGNMGGDFKSVIDTQLIELTLETISGKAALLSLLGFILIYFSCIKKSKISYILSFLGVSSILLSFVIFGHATKHGLVGQFLIIIHLVGLSYWIGSLLPLRKMCNFIEYEKLRLVAHLFGIYALGYVGVLIIAGLIFSYILLGDISSLITTDYGNVLLIKMIVVSMLLSLGAMNKFKIIPYLSINQNLGLKRLKNSIQIEIFCVLLILFFTSLLTTSLELPM